jgi:hypothetical protein
VATYRIICTRKEDVSHPYRHSHIVQVGTGTTPTHYDRIWTVVEVLTAISLGDTFYTVSPSTGAVAGVHRVNCAHCQAPTIRSAPDAVKDNNLDNLPACT